MKILFICKANAGRSQIANAFFNKLSKKNKSISAGVLVKDKEGEKLPEFVLKCMKEEGCNLSNEFRKQLTPEMVRWADKIIIMTEKENLPDYLISEDKKNIFWEVEDGKGMPYEFHIKIRDKIKGNVKRLIKEIDG